MAGVTLIVLSLVIAAHQTRRIRTGGGWDAVWIDFRNAFGLVWGNYKGLRTLWYDGGDAGFSSYMVRFTDQSFTVIVLSNMANGDEGQKAKRVVDLILTRRK